MIKRSYLSLFLLLCLALMLGALPGAAEGFTSGDFEYRLDEAGNAEITRYIGEANEMITVPASLDGHPVTAIGNGAFGVEPFGGNEWLVTVRLPMGLTRIGDEAFFRCYALKDIVFPETLEYIGESAFLSCESLTKMSLPVGLKSIGVDAFAGCVKLSEVSLPEGFNASIGAGAFSHCNSLKSLTIPDSLETLADNPFTYMTIKLKISKKHPRLELVKDVLFDKVDKTLIMYPFAAKQKSYEVPKGTLKIGGGAFYSASLSKITLPEGLTHIGDEAFSGCSKLSDLKLPDSLDVIGREAFYGCENLQALSLPANVGHIGMDAFIRSPGSQHHPEYIELSIPENSLTEKEWAGGSDLHLYLDYEAQAKDATGYIPARERYPGVPEMEVSAYLTRKGTFVDLDKVMRNYVFWPSSASPKSVYEKIWTDEAGEEYKLTLTDLSAGMKWLENNGWILLGEYIPSPFDLSIWWAVPPAQDGALSNTYYCSFLDYALLDSKLFYNPGVHTSGLNVFEFESEPLLQESLIAQLKEGKIRLDYNYVGKPD